MVPGPSKSSLSGGASPADAQGTPWWEILLRDGESSSPVVIEALQLFVSRAIRRSIGGKREGDTAFIEDITQEATVRLLKSLHTFRGDCQFTTWATTVSVRVAFTELRRARWKEVSLNQLLGQQDEGNAGSRYEPAAPEQRVLSERQLTAITAELAGMPLPELAEQLQTNPNALYKLLHDARKKLKQGLAEMGITEQDVRSTLDA
jgi:RNA polymerase sigma-70 factor (ECF subfamily)